MRRIVSSFIAIALLLCMVGCSTDKEDSGKGKEKVRETFKTGVIESHLIEDIGLCEDLQDGVNTDYTPDNTYEYVSHEVTKRIKHEEYKTENIFAMVTMSDDFFQVVYEICFYYTYYDDIGWNLDQTHISDKTITPLQGPSIDLVKEKALENSDYWDNAIRVYSSEDNYYYNGSVGMFRYRDWFNNVTVNEIRHSDQAPTVAEVHITIQTPIHTIERYYIMNYDRYGWNFEREKSIGSYEYNHLLYVTNVTLDTNIFLGSYNEIQNRFSGEDRFTIKSIANGYIEYDYYESNYSKTESSERGRFDIVSLEFSPEDYDYRLSYCYEDSSWYAISKWDGQIMSGQGFK